MDSTKTEIIIFIQRWIYHAGKSDEKNIFVGADALFDGNQRMYFASEIEYTFVYESIPGLGPAPEIYTGSPQQRRTLRMGINGGSLRLIV